MAVSSLYMCMVPLPPYMCASFCIYVEARSQLWVLFLRNLTFQAFVSYLTSNALISLTCLAIEPLAFSSLCPQCWDYRHELPHPALFCGFWGLNSGSHACTSSVAPAILFLFIYPKDRPSVCKMLHIQEYFWQHCLKI